MVDIAAVPTRRGSESLEVCRAIFGDRFAVRENLLALTLSNLNPPVHAANMLGNLTRAERGESWANHDITPAVGALIQAMDAERLGLAESLGVQVRTIQDHYVASFGTSPGEVHEMAEVVYKARPDAKGPNTLDTRFIDEDVPFGLFPLEMLGRMVGVPMPLHTAAIDIFSAIRKRDFRAGNPLLELLHDEFSQRGLLFDALQKGYVAN
ncbi:NAD/NADP octopine/nopaline dehydrogenase family protein [Paraburkholderia phytofirmans]|uniref:NAD/NADP octopine/nopaline dehydrogenase family protein n=1 Tax=Paraburkholderia phytofirmans TaxID=261302 RepID=UPI001427EB4B|nr:NAD/NADP octopine/nopaline dehydrogenase family protein [Paraburkholderia phytofirmans]